MKPPLLREAHGLKWVDRGSDTDDHLSFTGHEEGLRPILTGLLPAGGTFLDVGAHVGLWACSLASKAGEVWAFEPNPVTFDALVTNIEQNGLGDKVTPIPVALWDYQCRVSMRDWYGKVSGGSTSAHESAGADTAQGEKLDSVVGNRHPERIDLIKIDTEGAEPRVIRGALQTLMAFRPKIVLELHGGIQDVPKSADVEVYGILRNCGYEFSDEFEVSGGRHVVATPEEKSAVE